MVAIQKIFLATLSMTAVHAVEITNQCPSNQSLIGNSKCCPGYAIQDDESFCCVKDPDWKCDNVLTCFDGNCNAKVSIDDPDYDQKVSAASGTSTTSTGSTTASSETSAASPTDNAASGVREAALHMAAALAAVPVAFYAL